MQLIPVLVRALREIRHFQKSTGSILPKAVFMRLVRELLADAQVDAVVTRFQHTALLDLQEAAESFLVTVFEGMISPSISLGISLTAFSRQSICYQHQASHHPREGL